MVVTDEQIEEALINSSGQPAIAAKILNISYVQVYRRIRANKNLLDIQKAQRSKTFVELSQLTSFAIKTGFIQRSVLDEDGKITNDTQLEEIDPRTRMDAAFKLMGMFKGDEDIADNVNVNLTGSISPEKWLESIIDKPSEPSE